MPNAFRKLAAVALTILFVVPVSRTWAAEEKGRALAIAVVPVADGDRDEESAKLAHAIGQALSLTTTHHFINSDLTAQVLEYYDADAVARPPEAAGAEEALAKAKELYFQFRYDEARKELDRALALLEKERDDISAIGPVLLDAYLTKAVIAKSRGDSAGAREAAAAVLRLNPGFKPSPDEYPPSLVSVFDEERAILARRPSGSVRVETEPEVAEVFLNGIPQGVTPLAVDGLPAGSYSLLIRTNRYAPVERTIDVAEGKQLLVREKLRWASAESKTKGKIAQDAAAQVREGLRTADILKADKVILIDADANDSQETVTARMVDRAMRAGQPSLVLPLGDMVGERAKGLAEMSRRLAAQAAADITKNPGKQIEPEGLAAPVLLGKHRRPITKSPWFWGGVGAVAAGAIIGGVLGAMSGGSGDTGRVKVEFR